MTTPNAGLAYKVLDHIDAHPEQWDQETWLTEGPCGTRACFAGWAALLSGDKPHDCFDVISSATGRTRPVRNRARELLGITDSRADDLFDAVNTRERLGRLVEQFFGPRPGGAS